MARMARFKPIYSRKSETIDSWTTCTCNVSESLFRSKSHFLPRLARMEPEGNGQYTTVLQQGEGRGPRDKPRRGLQRVLAEKGVNSN